MPRDVIDALSFSVRQITHALREKQSKPWATLLSVAESGDSDPIQSIPPSQDQQIYFVLDMEQTNRHRDGGLILDTCVGKTRSDGTVTALKRASRESLERGDFHSEDDRVLRQLIIGAQEYWGTRGHASRVEIDPDVAGVVLTAIARSGKLLVRRSKADKTFRPIPLDETIPWKCKVILTPAHIGRTGNDAFTLSPVFVREDQQVPVSSVLCIVSGGYIVFGDSLGKFELNCSMEFLHALLRSSPIIPRKRVAEFARDFYQLVHAPQLEIPDEFNIPIKRVSLVPRLHIGLPPQSRAATLNSDAVPLPATLSFDYGGNLLPQRPASGAEILPDDTLLLRDAPGERAALEKLFTLGFQYQWDTNARGQILKIPAYKIPDAVLSLTIQGWHVEAEGSLYRRAGNFSLDINSTNIDWFDLNGKMEFGDQEIPLPRLLEALRKGEHSVKLDDGTIGILPQEWLKKYALLGDIGKPEGDSLRFSKTQIGLLDALLAAMPEVRCDELFNHARKQLAEFSEIKPATPADSFLGQLRPYQQEGLGWLHFLQQFNFGGCLADDMGLGKTVQVLALLESRRLAKAGPSLVVVPRSLIFNWISEAKKFAPQLRVLDQSGSDRVRGTDHLADYDLILSTYGTIRKDAAIFKDFEFDYVILDEAQAIKNATTDSAKAARILRGKHRLAMSGTPIENRLAEIWSLFEFLNPGMLGGATAFARLTAAKQDQTDATGRELLARTLRPFILRRTKKQVATDLPEKTEQTLYCELEGDQRKLYDELKTHYRASLLGIVDEVGINNSKMQVLEALLRLRQAACHPGLIDKSRANEPSAKLDALMDQLEDALGNGHKVLVFSQFTSLLALVKTRLDKAKINYEYLDGKTKDRDARVNSFQSDPSRNVFLISLKAGGVGLNLTSADYVFLLDPWWNPAVEAQAIDRTHRIGQTRQVFAYRIIAKDTVEEKVLELQKTKKDLADAIINADNGLVSNLTREDIAALLS